ncbi:MAG: alpha/beta hydrolase family protein [Acholeplasmataceae bacterium]
MNINLTSKNYCEVIFKDREKRDLLLILPGGGYEYTSKREALPVANAFMTLDLHAAIFYYREEKLLYPMIMDEALELIEKLKAFEFVKDIIVIGFSAGGHYAGLMLTQMSSFFKKGLMIYPVVSTLPEFAHKSSYEQLLGKKFTDDLIEEISIDLQVSDKTPPIFLMHSMDDLSVPVENSIDLMQALKKKGCYVESHFYPTGGHGISVVTKEVCTADDQDAFMASFGYIGSWIDLAKSFIERDIK